MSLIDNAIKRIKRRNLSNKLLKLLSVSHFGNSKLKLKLPLNKVVIKHQIFILSKEFYIISVIRLISFFRYSVLISGRLLLQLFSNLK